MARVKDFDTHISNLQVEIDKTTQKLQKLNEKMSILMHEKEENEISSLYQYIRMNNISMKDIAKTFKSDKDDTQNKTTSTRKPRAKSDTTQSRTKKSINKSFSNDNENKNRSRNSRSKKNDSK